MIRLAEEARADLRYIRRWYRPRAGAAITDRILETILASIERLERQPMSGRPGRRAGTRELVITRYPYLVIYRLAGEDVEIARVLHQAQQWPPAEGS